MSKRTIADILADPAEPLPLCQQPRLRITEKTGAQKGRYFVKAPGGSLFLLNEEERFLLSLLDGHSSFEAIDTAFAARFGLTLSPKDFATFLEQLWQAQLIQWVSGEEAVEVLAEPPRDASVSYPSRLGWRATRVEPFSIVVGNPDRFFRLLAAIFWPIRYITWVLVPFTFFTCIVLVHNAVKAETDYLYLLATIPWWPALWVVEHTLNVFSRIVEGAIIRGLGGQVLQFRFRLFLGILLRAFIDESSIEAMPLRWRLWVHGSTLVARLAVFDIGTLVWILCRPTHPIISKIGLFYSIVGIITFFVCTQPLIPQEGYHWLCTFLNQPDLNRRAWRFFGLRAKGHSAPRAMTQSERWGLFIMAVGSAIVWIGWVGRVIYDVDAAAVSAAQGLGFCFVLGEFLVAGLYFYCLRRFGRKLRALQRAERSQIRASELPPSPFEF